MPNEEPTNPRDPDFEALIEPGEIDLGDVRAVDHPGEAADDAFRKAQQIRHAWAREGLPVEAMAIHVIGDAAYFNGTVTNDAQWKIAERLAILIPGIARIDNGLAIGKTGPLPTQGLP